MAKILKEIWYCIGWTCAVIIYPFALILFVMYKVIEWIAEKIVNDK